MWFKWCLRQANELKGTYTGEPNEEIYNANLKDSRKAFKELKSKHKFGYLKIK